MCKLGKKRTNIAEDVIETSFANTTKEGLNIVGNNSKEEEIASFHMKATSDYKSFPDSVKEIVKPRLVSCIKGFNVPKNEENGEDADPYDYVDPTKSWGVICVFDGMGGAGGHKYVHPVTQEEHTSAYWASRFVRDAVETLINDWNIKDVRDNPISFIETQIGQRIKDKLNSEIIHFQVESSIKSKMIRKLPTTLALCVYELNDDVVHVVTYWAGDSRIYMFDLERMSFLTIDDADAPDNDPFSPANMDLVMTNTICQDRSFYISKYERNIAMDNNKPFVLLACTDGCFGYFKNPIEFEYMVRTELKNSNDWDNWSERMKDAIIQNGQNDDLSLVGVVLGIESKSFDDFKLMMQQRLNDSIFEEYFSWKRESLQKLDVMKGEVNMLKDELSLIHDVYEIAKFLECKPNVPKPLMKEFLEKICQCNQAKLDNDMSTYENQLNDKRKEFEKKKIEFDELQQKHQEENNEWYEKYKKTISYEVKPITEIYHA